MDKKENVQAMQGQWEAITKQWGGIETGQEGECASNARPIRSHDKTVRRHRGWRRRRKCKHEYLVVVAAALSFSKEADETWQQLWQVRPEVIS